MNREVIHTAAMEKVDEVRAYTPCTNDGYLPI